MTSGRTVGRRYLSLVMHNYNDKYAYRLDGFVCFILLDGLDPSG